MGTFRDQIEVLQRAEGFYESAVLLTLVRLGVFDFLDEDVTHVEPMAKRIGARPDHLRRLLDTAVVLRILSLDQDSGYGLGQPCFRVLLPSAGADCIADWLKYLDLHRNQLCNLETAILGNPTPEQQHESELASDESTRVATWAMHGYAMTRGREVVDHLDLQGATSLLDLGCGPGTYAFLLGAANPGLALTLVDRESVLTIAREIEQTFSLSNPVRYIAGNVEEVQLDGPFDVIFASNLLHALSQSERELLINRLFTQLAPGGSVVVQGQFLDADQPGPRWAHLLDLELLSEGGHASNHSIEETIGQLTRAGFIDIQTCPMSLANTNRFVRGRKPA